MDCASGLATQIWAPSAIVICLGFLPLAARGDIVFKQLEVPGAIDAYATAVSGDVAVGSYKDASHVWHGARWEGSTYITLDPPGSTATLPKAIDGNTVVGSYGDSSGKSHGFVWDGSTYTILDAPGSTGTFPIGVSGGYVVGTYYTATGQTVAFIWKDSSYSTLTTVGPGAAPYAMRSSGGSVVGYYVQPHFATHPTHGFLWDGINSVVLDFPGAYETYPVGISGGMVVGTSTPQVGAKAHAFLWDGTSYRDIDPPDAISGHATNISGSNVVAQFSDANGVEYAAFWEGATHMTIGFPGASVTALTNVSGFNVVGYYLYEDHRHAFFATVPEPSGVLTAVAVALIAIRRRFEPRRRELEAMRAKIAEPAGP